MAASEAFARYRKWLVALAVVLGIVLIVIAVIYWVEPADSLPSFFPGHETGLARVRVKHGLAAGVVGILLIAIGWFFGRRA